MKKIKSIKISKPTTSGRRGVEFVNRAITSNEKPVKSLSFGYKRSVGRDSSGTISIRHKGGGAKRKFRVISTLDQCGKGPYEVVRHEYDPNRTSFITLIKNADQKLFYILAPKSLKDGAAISYGDKIDFLPGNRSRIGIIPTGMEIHSVELTPQSRGKMVRSAGSSAVVMSHEANHSLVKMPSGEIRKFHNNCLASIGRVSNEAHNTISIGKAGRKRHMGIRPTVRGKAMHPAAHPHGGGEGVNPIGLKAPKTPWGKKAIGARTRRRFDKGNFIIKRRGKKRRK